jgi:peptidoglycan LD-endopeptidase LytH
MRRHTLLAMLALLLLAGCMSPGVAGSPPTPAAITASATPPQPSPERPTARATQTPAPTLVAASATPAPPSPISVIVASATPVPPSPTTPVQVIVAVPLTPTAPNEPAPGSAAPTAPAPPPASTAAEGTLSYVFPVQGARVQYGAAHHTYPATDIFCPTGSLFVAPTSGVIDFVSYEDNWNPAADDPAIRGGLSVAMIGDDGVRYYGSHLSAISDGIVVGARVAAGQPLGLTGNSGNARSTPPHLHFGISRPTTPDDWSVRRGQISPYPYLQAWERGEALTPQLP